MELAAAALEGLAAAAGADVGLRRRLDAHLAFLDAEIEDLDRDIGALLRRSPTWRAQIQAAAGRPAVVDRQKGDAAGIAAKAVGAEMQTLTGA